MRGQQTIEKFLGRMERRGGGLELLCEDARQNLRGVGNKQIKYDRTCTVAVPVVADRARECGISGYVDSLYARGEEEYSRVPCIR